MFNNGVVRLFLAITMGWLVLSLHSMLLDYFGWFSCLRFTRVYMNALFVICFWITGDAFITEWFDSWLLMLFVLDFVDCLL